MDNQSLAQRNASTSGWNTHYNYYCVICSRYVLSLTFGQIMASAADSDGYDNWFCSSCKREYSANLLIVLAHK